ncbi:MAG: zf-HC2 domain-containing protein [Acidobacteria bacterium]|nr:MAG: zf-HC2 domain-containing protein [Acidobacteriota bacterium]
MTDKCNHYRDLIPRALLGDLEAGRAAELEGHLSECAECRAEREQYGETLDHLAMVEDEPVPGHFFIPADARNASLRDLFGAVAWPWKLATATGLVALLLLAGLGLSALQFRSAGGVYAFSFGRPLPEWDNNAKNEAAIQALRVEMRSFVEETIQSERKQYLATLRSELARSSRGLAPEQRRFLQVALNDIEKRMNERMVTTGASIAAETASSMDTLYARLQAQRSQDLALIRKSITDTARVSQANDRQTQEVLTTLLEVADLQIKRGIN